MFKQKAFPKQWKTKLNKLRWKLNLAESFKYPQKVLPYNDDQ